MRVVGLISGGKDSCYNMMRCVDHGHSIECVANLYPPGGSGEIDSYMYQSVASEAIDYYASALDVPLYRRAISGQPLQRDAQYERRDGDEVEDLYELLQHVLKKHPDVKGVSVGAIHSSYQNERVMHVCERLQLTPLCYLWHADQQQLLADIIDSGVKAIIVKVAALGLNAMHLGRPLSDVSAHLRSLHAKYGVHVCGEGGEYETLVLDCPLFKRPIVWQGRMADDGDVVTHVKDDVAPVLYLKLHNRLSLGDVKAA